MKGKYVFYTFNSLDWYHVRLAIESIARQDFGEIFEFVIYNNSTVFESEKLLEFARTRLAGKFAGFSVRLEYPQTDKTFVDVQYIVEHITGADLYFVHKADFVLCGEAIQKSIDDFRETPWFVGFCKYDLRENVGEEEIKELSRKTYDEIMTLPSAGDATGGQSFGFEINKIGYTGFDGTMHLYNEAARRVLHFDNYISSAIDENKARGVEWIYGDKNYTALHIFHAIESRGGSKNHPGYRY